MFKRKFKQGISFLLSLMMVLSLNTGSVFAADAETGADTLLPAGTYKVPVASLTSAAPLPPVNAAFATAFGSEAEITADENGNMTAVVELQHMIVSMGGDYHANIKTVTGAEYLSYKTVQSSTTFGDPTAITEIEVPSKVRFAMPAAEADGTYKIEITVDFMDNLMGKGNPYPTKVTLTLAFDNAEGVSLELSSLVNACKVLSEESYTTDTWAELKAALANGEKIVANGGTVAENQAAAEALSTAKDNLKFTGADYTKVNEALAKIPSDSSLYTKSSWDALAEAKDAVVQGLTVDKQTEVDGFASDIEAKIAALVYADADYTNVDAAIAKIPSDLTKYTADSVKALQTARDAVVRSLKANEQSKVDKMASDIETAVKGLVKSTDSDDSNNPGNDNDTNSPDDSGAADNGALDKENLKDGIYNVSVKLWNATSDQASMAASSVYDTARIVVKNNTKTMYVYTQEMTMGSITASLQEMQVADANGNYSSAAIVNKDASGNPTCFSFSLPHTEEYIKVKVNPQVAIMGNQALDARLKVDYTTLKMVSEDPDDSSVDVTAPAAGSQGGTTSTGGTTGTSSKTGSTVKTGDYANMSTYAILFLLSACGVVTLVSRKRRLGR